MIVMIPPSSDTQKEIQELAERMAEVLKGRRCPVAASAIAGVAGMLIGTHANDQWGDLFTAINLAAQYSAHYHEKHPDRNPLTGVLCHDDNNPSGTVH